MRQPWFLGLTVAALVGFASPARAQAPATIQYAPHVPGLELLMRPNGSSAWFSLCPGACTTQLNPGDYQVQANASRAVVRNLHLDPGVLYSASTFAGSQPAASSGFVPGPAIDNGIGGVIAFIVGLAAIGGGITMLAFADSEGLEIAGGTMLGIGGLVAATGIYFMVIGFHEQISVTVQPMGAPGPNVVVPGRGWSSPQTRPASEPTPW